MQKLSFTLIGMLFMLLTACNSNSSQKEKMENEKDGGRL